MVVVSVAVNREAKVSVPGPTMVDSCGHLSDSALQRFLFVTRSIDPRAAKTRTALLNAFLALLQERDYDDMRVEDIVERAQISRSTFYKHHTGKDALLAASVAGPFAVLADALRGDAGAERLEGLLDHFWANRASARSVLTGSMRRRTTAVLVTVIEQRLDAVGCGHRGALVLPRHLCAVQLAELLLAPVSAWLLGESQCSGAALAAGLCRVGAATLDAMKVRLGPHVGHV